VLRRRVRTLEGVLHPGRKAQWEHPLVIL